jgi:hypothetical protein
MFDFIFDLFSGGNKYKVNLNPDQKKEVEILTRDLIEIGIKEDFLSERPGGAFDGHCHHRRAREIGEKLNAMDGMDLMWKVFYRVKRKAGKQLSEHLEYAWSGIGQWMA